MLVGQGAKGLGQKPHRIALEGEFARFRAEQSARDAYDIAHIELFEHLEGVVAQGGTFGIALDAAAAILQMKKDDLAERA